jgi:hypothetical protein
MNSRKFIRISQIVNELTEMGNYDDAERLINHDELTDEEKSDLQMKKINNQQKITKSISAFMRRLDVGDVVSAIDFINLKKAIEYVYDPTIYDVRSMIRQLESGFTQGGDRRRAKKSGKSIWRKMLEVRWHGGGGMDPYISQDWKYRDGGR